MVNLYFAEVLHFCYTTEWEVKKETLNLPPKKATVGDIPVKVIKIKTATRGLLLTKCS